MSCTWGNPPYPTTLLTASSQQAGQNVTRAAPPYGAGAHGALAAHSTTCTHTHAHVSRTSVFRSRQHTRHTSATLAVLGHRMSHRRPTVSLVSFHVSFPYRSNLAKRTFDATRARRAGRQGRRDTHPTPPLLMSLRSAHPGGASPRGATPGEQLRGLLITTYLPPGGNGGHCNPLHATQQTHLSRQHSPALPEGDNASQANGKSPTAAGAGAAAAANYTGRGRAPDNAQHPTPASHACMHAGGSALPKCRHLAAAAVFVALLFSHSPPFISSTPADVRYARYAALPPARSQLSRQLIRQRAVPAATRDPRGGSQLGVAHAVHIRLIATSQRTLPPAPSLLRASGGRGPGLGGPRPPARPIPHTHTYRRGERKHASTDAAEADSAARAQD
ncbi:hypothetical protein PLESTM_000413400 [Pleodorina starrii]|nr:hypothetical protein PLESTM_000413400 [Pleodorina starrii]